MKFWLARLGEGRSFRKIHDVIVTARYFIINSNEIRPEVKVTVIFLQ